MGEHWEVGPAKECNASSEEPIAIRLISRELSPRGTSRVAASPLRSEVSRRAPLASLPERLALEGELQRPRDVLPRQAERLLKLLGAHPVRGSPERRDDRVDRALEILRRAPAASPNPPSTRLSGSHNAACRNGFRVGGRSAHVRGVDAREFRQRRALQCLQHLGGELLCETRDRGAKLGHACAFDHDSGQFVIRDQPLFLGVRALRLSRRCSPVPCSPGSRHVPASRRWWPLDHVEVRRSAAVPQNCNVTVSSWSRGARKTRRPASRSRGRDGPPRPRSHRDRGDPAGDRPRKAASLPAQPIR